MSIQIAAVLGSMRRESYTRRCLDMTLDALRTEADVELILIDPADLRLTFPGAPGADALMTELRVRLERAEGFLLATPEYHGSYSSVIKAIIDAMGFPSPMAGKNVAMLGVAAGRIGAVKALEHLRSVCSHVGALVLPNPVSVAQVREAFGPDGQCADADVRERLEHLPHHLLDHVRGRLHVEESMEGTMRGR